MWDLIVRGWGAEEDVMAKLQHALRQMIECAIALWASLYYFRSIKGREWRNFSFTSDYN